MASSEDSTRIARGPAAEAHVVRLLDEYLNRQAAGEALNEETLLAAHPDCADELREHLELVRHLKPRQQRIEELLARGVLQPSPDGACSALLDTYPIHGVLGEGGMGVVLDGRDPRLKRRVALKILRPELAQDVRALARFEREATTAGALQHPNVVTVYGVGCARGTHYIAMEHVDGPSLAHVVNLHAPLPPILVRRILRQILEGLAAAHGSGLIHRDIKSSNILLAQWTDGCETGCGDSGSQPPDGCPISLEVGDGCGCPISSEVGERIESCNRAPSSGSLDHPSSLEGKNAADVPTLGRRRPVVKIADFGLARMRSSQTQLTLGDSILGTPEYMSPEQARGDAEIDHRTDLYSAGVILYEMLTGRTPFKAATPTATIRRILDEEPQDPRELDKNTDANLASLALRLMEKKPHDRFASATEALAALGSDQFSHRASHQRRRRRRAFGLVAGAALVCAAVWAAWLFAVRQPSIVAVRIDPATRRAVQVRCGKDAEWRVVHQFPPEAPRILKVSDVDPDGRGRKVAVAGLEGQWEGSNIFAFDANGGRLWASYLHDESGRTWPDCAATAGWFCLALARGNLDGKRGDELVVVASEVREYPTFISIVDPRTGQVQPRSTFWHMGDLQNIQIVEDFFEDGRPAIIAWGCNNKLDGFDVPLRNDSSRLTHWDMVPVVVVLDPNDMDGLGPPQTSRPELQNIPPARPYAYAFLDLARNPDVLQVVDTGDEHRPERRTAESRNRDQMGGIKNIDVLPRRATDNGAPRFEIEIVWFPETEKTPRGRAFLRLARDLTLLEVVPILGEKTGITKGYWDRHWHPIIQNGQYVDG